MPLALKAIRPSKFELLDPERTKAACRAGMRRYLQEVAQQMSVYPEPRGQTYVRTYRLQDGWLSEVAIKVSADGSEGTLINPRRYAARVQGPRGTGTGSRQEVKFRRLGWQSISDVARKTRPRYKQIMNRAIRGSAQ